MVTQKEYQELSNRIQEAERTALRFEAEQKVIRERREVLLKELKEAKIDTDHLPEEQARLEQEIEADYQQALKEVEAFEREMAEHTKPTGSGG